MILFLQAHHMSTTRTQENNFDSSHGQTSLDLVPLHALAQASFLHG